MLVKGHLMEMFNLGWSDRKINSVTGCSVFYGLPFDVFE